MLMLMALVSDAEKKSFHLSTEAPFSEMFLIITSLVVPLTDVVED